MSTALDIEAWRSATREIGRILEKVRRAMRQFSLAFSGVVNDEVRVSGLEARLYVRGGFSSEGEVGRLVVDLMHGEVDEARFLTRENRARLACAAIRGHVDHTRGRDRQGALPWHRYLAATRVEVD